MTIGIQSIFGMNVREITPHTRGTLSHYAATVIMLTLFTIWVFVAFQTKHYFRIQNQNIWMRVLWPVMLVQEWFTRKRRMRQDRVGQSRDDHSASLR